MRALSTTAHVRSSWLLKRRWKKSIDWFKGNVTGKSNISGENLWLPIGFPLSQPIEFMDISLHPILTAPGKHTMATMENLWKTYKKHQKTIQNPLKKTAKKNRPHPPPWLCQ